MTEISDIDCTAVCEFDHQVEQKLQDFGFDKLSAMSAMIRMALLNIMDQYQLARSHTLLQFISSSSGPNNSVLTHSFFLVTLIAIAMCRARVLSFCIRAKQLPLEVHIMNSGFSSSTGHTMRVCKILQSEWLRQGCLYRESLYIQIQPEKNKPRSQEEKVAGVQCTHRPYDRINVATGLASSPPQHANIK